MPQMSPMFWILLMFYFIMILIIMMMFIYFSFLLSPKKMIDNYSKHYLNWKW